MVPARPATPARSPRPTPASGRGSTSSISPGGRAFVVLVDRCAAWITTADSTSGPRRRTVDRPARWYGHEPERFDELRRYRHELREEPALTSARLAQPRQGRCSSSRRRAVERSGARVLRDSLRRRLRS